MHPLTSPLLAYRLLFLSAYIVRITDGNLEFQQLVSYLWIIKKSKSGVIRPEKIPHGFVVYLHGGELEHELPLVVMLHTFPGNTQLYNIVTDEIEEEDR